MTSGSAPRNTSSTQIPFIKKLFWSIGLWATGAITPAPIAPAELHDGSLNWQSGKDVIRLLDKLMSHYMEGLGRKVWLQFTGGEPTLHPGISDIVHEAHGRGMHVSLISNGSRTIRFWEKSRDLLDSVILTLHSEEADLEHFTSVIGILSERSHVQVNVTMIPERFDRICDVIQEIAQLHPDVDIVPKPLRLGFGHELYPYSEKQLDWMKRQVQPPPRDGRLRAPRSLMTRKNADGSSEEIRANQFILRGENRWRGWTCEAGIESLRVTGDGSVSRAVCGVGGQIGTLPDDLMLPLDSVVCTKDACACVADILISKAKWS